MYVYRIEHSQYGHGPYRVESDSPDLIELADDMGMAHMNATHPNMRDDMRFNLYADISDYYCGFGSIEDLSAWFDDMWLDLMHICGYVMTVYDVDSDLVVCGVYQLAFKKARATLVDSLSLSDVITLTES